MFMTIFKLIEKQLTDCGLARFQMIENMVINAIITILLIIEHDGASTALIL